MAIANSMVRELCDIDMCSTSVIEGFRVCADDDVCVYFHGSTFECYHSSPRHHPVCETEWMVAMRTDLI